MRYDISFVIPFYEYDDTDYDKLKRTLQSIDNSSFGTKIRKEVIIVTDNPDKPFQYSKIRFISPHPIVVENETNRGILSSRVIGWDKASCKNIMNIDNGDELSRDANLSAMIEYSEEGLIPSLSVAEYLNDELLGEDISCPNNYMGGSSICGKVYNKLLLLRMARKYSLDEFRICNKEDVLFSLLLRLNYPDLVYNRNIDLGQYLYFRDANSTSNFVDLEKLKTDNLNILSFLLSNIELKELNRVVGKVDSNWRHLCKIFVDLEYALEKLNEKPLFKQLSGYRMREFYDTPMTKIEETTEHQITQDLFLVNIRNIWRNRHENLRCVNSLLQ